MWLGSKVVLFMLQLGEILESTLLLGSKMLLFTLLLGEVLESILMLGSKVVGSRVLVLVDINLLSSTTLT